MNSISNYNYSKFKFEFLQFKENFENNENLKIKDYENFILEENSKPDEGINLYF